MSEEEVQKTHSFKTMVALKEQIDKENA